MTSSLSSATPSTPELRARLTMIKVIAKRCMRIRQAVMLRKHGYGGHRFYNIKRGGDCWMPLALRGMPMTDITSGTTLPSFEVLVKHMDDAGVPGTRPYQRVRRWTVWVWLALSVWASLTKKETLGLCLEHWAWVSWHRDVSLVYRIPLRRRL